MTPGPVVLVLLSPFAGSIADRYGYRWPLTIGATLATIGTAWLAWRLAPGARYVTAFLPGTLSIGVGMALMLGPANAAALRDVPPEQLSSANAAYSTLRSAAGGLGVAVCAAIIGDTAAGDRLEAYRIGWWVMVAVMALGPLLLWLRYPRNDAPLPSGAQ